MFQEKQYNKTASLHYANMSVLVKLLLKTRVSDIIFIDIGRDNAVHLKLLNTTFSNARDIIKYVRKC